MTTSRTESDREAACPGLTLAASVTCPMFWSRKHMPVLACRVRGSAPVSPASVPAVVSCGLVPWMARRAFSSVEQWLIEGHKKPLPLLRSASLVPIFLKCSQTPREKLWSIRTNTEEVSNVVYSAALHIDLHFLPKSMPEQVNQCFVQTDRKLPITQK